MASGATAPARMNHPAAAGDNCAQSAHGPMTDNNTAPMVRRLKVMAVAGPPVRRPQRTRMWADPKKNAGAQGEEYCHVPARPEDREALPRDGTLYNTRVR